MLRQKGAPWPSLYSKLPGRTSTAVRKKWRKIATRNERGEILYHVHRAGSRWTAEEDERVKKLKMEGMTFEYITQLLPGRSLQATTGRWLNALQPRYQAWDKTRRRSRWTEKEHKLLLQYRNEDLLPFDVIAKNLSRTVSAVMTQYMIHMKGEAKPKVNAPYWTVEEDRKLRQLLYNQIPMEEIGRQTGRTPDVVQARAFAIRDIEEGPRVLRSPNRVHLPAVIDLHQQGVPWKDIASRFPGATIPSLKAIYYRYQCSLEAAKTDQTLGRPKVSGMVYLPAVTDLRQQRVSWKDIGDRFPDATIAALQLAYYRHNGNLREATTTNKRVAANLRSTTPGSLQDVA